MYGCFSLSFIFSLLKLSKIKKRQNIAWDDFYRGATQFRNKLVVTLCLEYYHTLSLLRRIPSKATILFTLALNSPFTQMNLCCSTKPTLSIKFLGKLLFYLIGFYIISIITNLKVIVNCFITIFFGFLLSQTFPTFFK